MTLNTSMMMAALALFAAACGSQAVPNSQMADAKAAISAAEATGAQDVPEASLYLKMAKDGVQQAEKHIEAENNETAAELLERAKMDAKLAKSLTTEQQVKAEAERAIQRIEELQSQAGASS